MLYTQNKYRNVNQLYFSLKIIVDVLNSYQKSLAPLSLNTFPVHSHHSSERQLAFLLDLYILCSKCLEISGVFSILSISMLQSKQLI